ncbi:DUF6712 family protein [Marivirga sp.]|uniref:DUF6712 family protein n=1 Tax=Marivirga sp. TaxID=2018662 RepID=UPI003DA78F13
MKLVTENIDFKDYVSLTAAFTFKKVKPELTIQENSLKIDILGQIYYDYLTNDPNPALPAEQEEKRQEIIDKCRTIIINKTFGTAIDIIQVSISDTGVQRNEDTSKKSAYRYQKEEARQYLLKNALIATDQLLVMLSGEGNWDNSIIKSYSLLISDYKKFDDLASISGSPLTFQALRQYLDYIENTTIVDEVGFEFLENIATKEEPNSDEKTVLKHLRVALANLTLAEAMKHLPIIIENDAISVVSKSSEGESKTPVNPDLFRMKHNSLMAIGNNSLHIAKRYLDSNAKETLFQIYYESDYYTPIGGDSSYEQNEDSNIYLG